MVHMYSTCTCTVHVHVFFMHMCTGCTRILYDIMPGAGVHVRFESRYIVCGSLLSTIILPFFTVAVAAAGRYYWNHSFGYNTNCW